MGLKFDQIGAWSELKLEIVRDYAKAYSTILARQPRLGHVYIDAFAGAGITDLVKSGGNKQVVAAFRERLREVAGFKEVPEPIPMRNMKGATVYYLFFASHNETGAKIARHLMNKYRT